MWENFYLLREKPSTPGNNSCSSPLFPFMPTHFSYQPSFFFFKSHPSCLFLPSHTLGPVQSQLYLPSPCLISLLRRTSHHLLCLYPSKDPRFLSLPPTPPKSLSSSYPSPLCSPQFPRPLLGFLHPTSPPASRHHASFPSGCNGKSSEKTRGKSVLAPHAAAAGRD